MVRTITENDTTPLKRKLRFVRRVNGRRVKTRVVFDDTGAERIPQKMCQPFPEINLRYFQEIAPKLGSYQVTLRPWLDESNP